MRTKSIDETKNKLTDKMMLFETTLKVANNMVLDEHYKVSKLDFINFYQNAEVTLNFFETQNWTEIKNKKGILNERDHKVKDICKKACVDSYTLFLGENRIGLDGSDLDDQYKDEDKSKNKPRGHLIGDGSNRKMEFTQLAAQRTH
jgi:hypothetical protein